MVGLALEPAAFAEDALNSSVKPKHEASAFDQGPHDEFNLLPVAGGTTDIGIGGGYFAGLAREEEGYDPYIWNIESAGLLTFKVVEGEKVVFPYQDDYVQLTVPRLFGIPLRLEVRTEWSWETTLGYYGLGNASPSPPASASKVNQYGRLHPELLVDVRWRVVDHVAAMAGLDFTQSWLQIDPSSKLASDLQTGSPEVKSLLGKVGTAGVASAIAGMQFDTRENEVSSHSGTYDTVSLKVSPGGLKDAPYRYAEMTAIGRLFVPIWNPRIVLAMRLAGDVLVGQPPFYELSRFQDAYATYALGGQNGVRGIPGQRYYGKVKVLGNLELRTEIVSFRALGKHMNFGVVAFADGGRVWADTSFHPELDGSRVGIKYGVGGGLRLQSGSSFVLRADVAYSPDASALGSPVGGYFAAGQMF